MTISDSRNRVIHDLSGDYQLDPAHSRLGFVARHAMVTNVRGHFRDLSGALYVDTGDPSQSRTDITVQAASLTTGNGQRDAHLIGPDCIDVERYPTITFKSTRVDRVEGDRFRLAGDVTIKDENHPVIFAIDYMGSAKDPYGNVRAGFDARADLSRKEWGFTSNVVLETGGFLVSDKIELAIDVSAVKLTTTSP